MFSGGICHPKWEESINYEVLLVRGCLFFSVVNHLIALRRPIQNPCQKFMIELFSKSSLPFKYQPQEMVKHTHWRIQFNLISWSPFSLKTMLGHIKVLYVYDVCCAELTFITSYYICSWLLIVFFSNEWCLLHQIFISTILNQFLNHLFYLSRTTRNFETSLPVWFE